MNSVRPSWLKRFPFLLIAVVIGLLLMDAGTDWPMAWPALTLLLAQSGFHCIIAGWVGRHWIVSYLIGLVVSLAAFGLFFWSFSRFVVGEDTFVLFLGMCGLLPTLLLSGTAPLLFLRSFFGTTLTRGVTPVSSAKLQLEDFFLGTGVVAVALMSCRNSALFVTFGNGVESQFAMVILFISLVPFIASAVSVLPVSLSYFRCQTRSGRIGVLTGFAMLGLVAGVLYGYFASRIDARWIFSIVFQVSTFSILLVLLRASGYRLSKSHVNDAVHPESTNPPEENAQVQVPFRLPNRIAFGCMLIISTGYSFWLSRETSRRAELADHLQKVDAQLLQRGGRLLSIAHRVDSLIVPPSADAEELSRLLDYKNFTSVRLKDVEVTSDDCARLAKLPTLQYLDLRGSTIDDAGFSKLVDRYYFETLQMGGTKVSPSALRTAFQKLSVANLDLSDLGLSDEQLNELKLDDMAYIMPKTKLNLAGNPITDEGINTLGKINILDLSRTRIEGKSFDKLTAIERLIVDQTEFDDSALSQLSSSAIALDHISIRDTKVTDAGLAALKKFKLLNSLDIGEGPITVGGLQASGRTGWKHLGLNAKKFDGKMFMDKNNPFAAEELDMSDSGMTDADIPALQNVSALTKLSLARCNITAAALPALKDLNLQEVDLTDTAIQAEDVRMLHGFVTRVRLSLKQCGNNVPLYVKEGFQIAEWSDWPERF